MHEILNRLSAGQRVLDLGARYGSFDLDHAPGALVVRVDLEERPGNDGATAVQADAAALPFRDRSFDAVIANHSLEHMTELHRVLRELGRILRPSSALYIAVPDSTTFSDRLYRWVYHGGGHVNLFRAAEALDETIRQYVALPGAGWRLLHTSFGFLNKENFHPRPPRRMWLFCNGHYAAIVVLGYIARILDRQFHTRLSVYGWAMYYGSVEVERDVWTNVCAQCGAAHSPAQLSAKAVFWRIRYYRCPVCNAWNLFTPDDKPRAF